MKAWLVYKNLGLRWAFTFRKPYNDEIYDEVEIELPDGAEFIDNGVTPFIMGKGDIPNEEIITMLKRKNSTLQTGQVQREPQVVNRYSMERFFI